ncbi:MAG TPA: NADH-quinone oxidoreductase subunit L [Parasegetibacter sp.]
MTKLVYLVPLFPLIGFLINGLMRKNLSKAASGIIGSGTILASFVVSVMLFMQLQGGSISVPPLFDFIHIDQIHIPFAFQIDQLSSLFLLVITGVGFLIHLYSTSYMKEEEPHHFARYFSYLNLFVFSMLLLVLGSNFVVMFIGWEGVGLCSYLLIGFWFKNNNYNNAAKKAFIMNRIGDLAFLIAMFWMVAKLGSLTFSEVFSEDSLALLTTTDITGITLLLFIGATGKSAQIPLYTWLPDAMAGPTPVSALIHAATMVTAGIYMIARSNVLYTMAPVTQQIVAVIGLATALLAATIAFKQNDIKKVLAYSTVSQLGYMFLALGVGAFTGAVFHVITHAFFKALLFLGAGSVIHAMHHEQDIRRMGGLKKYLPVTHITFLLGCLAIAGIPPFSGFFSKDEILMGAYAKNPLLYYLGVAGALLTAFYMFRLYAMTFLGKFRGNSHSESHANDAQVADDHATFTTDEDAHGSHNADAHSAHQPHESPSAMTIPLVVLALLAVVGGFMGIPEIFMRGGHWLQEYLAPVFAGSAARSTPHAIDHSLELILMAVSTVLIIVVCLLAVSKFRKYQSGEEASTGLGKFLENKWYIDELYDTIIVKPLMWLAKFLNNIIERYVIDGFVNGVGRAVQYSGRQIRLLQTGQVGGYILLMVICVILFFVIKFFL